MLLLVNGKNIVIKIKICLDLRVIMIVAIMGLKSVTQDQLRQCTCCFYVSLVCIHYGIEICYIR